MEADQGPKAVPLERRAFEEFDVKHARINRFFWSTLVSYHLASAMTNAQPDHLPVQKMLYLTDERRYAFRRYLSRERDSEPRARARMSDLRSDMKANVNRMVESAIISCLANLEFFLRKWAITAARVELEIKTSRRTGEPRKEQLSRLITALESNPRLAMTIAGLAEHFPAAINALKTTTHKRTTNPLLSVPIPGVACLDAAQMWRETRNLLLHHDGRCHESFVRDWRVVWDAINEDLTKDGLGATKATLKAGKRIPLGKRHAIYCLSSCYQTAYVFHIAGGGSQGSVRQLPMPGEARRS